jgi:hypothetical protein
MFLAILMSASTPLDTSNNLHLEIRNNCRIIFLPNNSSFTTGPDALSLDGDTLNEELNKCNKTWSMELNEWTTVLLLRSGDSKSAVNNLRKTELSQKQHLKIAVLLAYQSGEAVKLTQFCLLLDVQELKEQCFSDTFKRMMLSRSSMIDILTFWFHFVKSGSHIPYDQQQNANASKNAIIANFTADMDTNCYKLFYSKLASLEKEVERFYIPSIISGYFKHNYSLTTLIKCIYQQNDLACMLVHEMYLNLEIYGRLDSMDALELHIANRDLRKNDDNKLCDDVDRALLLHTPAHVKPFLEHFDEEKYDELRKNRLTVGVVSEIVKQRYEGGNKTEALMRFLWNKNELSDIACVGSLALVKEMNKSGNLASVEALSLFSQVKSHRLIFDTRIYTDNCLKVQDYAQVILT